MRILICIRCHSQICKLWNDSITNRAKKFVFIKHFPTIWQIENCLAYNRRLCNNDVYVKFYREIQLNAKSNELKKSIEIWCLTVSIVIAQMNSAKTGWASKKSEMLPSGENYKHIFVVDCCTLSIGNRQWSLILFALISREKKLTTKYRLKISSKSFRWSNINCLHCTQCTSANFVHIVNHKQLWIRYTVRVWCVYGLRSKEIIVQ